MTLLTLAQEAGLKPVFAAYTHGGEYHSACPKCGGNDRFILQPTRKQKNCIGSYFCRQCNISGDAIQFGRDFLSLSFKEAVLRAEGSTQERALIPYKPAENTFKPTTAKSTNEIWFVKATAFIQYAHTIILPQAETLAFLEHREIPRDAIVQYKIGWNPETHHRSSWCIDKDVWLPKGIVIPLMQQNKITGIKIRRTDYKDGDAIGKYIVVTGGSDSFSIYGQIKEYIALVVVESELDAIALQYAVRNICTIAIGGNNKNPTFLVDYLARNERLNLIIVPDNDDGGTAMLTKWQSLYPHARIHRVPFGKDIGEAVQQGLQLREWFLSAVVTSPTTPTILKPITIEIPSLPPASPILTVPTIQEEDWSPEAQALILWYRKYLEYIEEYSPVTRNLTFYLDAEKDIALGANGKHVEPLLYKLHKIKQTIEEAPIYNGSRFHTFMVKYYYTT